MKTLVRISLVMFALSAFSTTAVERKSRFDGPLPTCIPTLKADCSVPALL